jgi:CRISPR-associated protein Cmr3
VNPTSGEVVKLGGEGKIAKLEEVCEVMPEIKVEARSDYFKLYLATPSIFKNGWLPEWINPNTMEGAFIFRDKKIKVKLLTAAVRKFVTTGGYGYDTEVEEHRPREMRYAVPAGSVYYFKILEGDFNRAITLFNQKCISDYRESLGFLPDNNRFKRTRFGYCDRGFGYVLVGKLTEDQIKEFEKSCLKKKV